MWSCDAHIVRTSHLLSPSMSVALGKYVTPTMRPDNVQHKHDTNTALHNGSNNKQRFNNLACYIFLSYS